MGVKGLLRQLKKCFLFKPLHLKDFTNWTILVDLSNLIYSQKFQDAYFQNKSEDDLAHSLEEHIFSLAFLMEKYHIKSRYFFDTRKIKSKRQKPNNKPQQQQSMKWQQMFVFRNQATQITKQILKSLDIPLEFVLLQADPQIAYIHKQLTNQGEKCAVYSNGSDFIIFGLPLITEIKITPLKENEIEGSCSFINMNQDRKVAGMTPQSVKLYLICKNKCKRVILGAFGSFLPQPMHVTQLINLISISRDNFEYEDVMTAILDKFGHDPPPSFSKHQVKKQMLKYLCPLVYNSHDQKEQFFDNFEAYYYVHSRESRTFDSFWNIIGGNYLKEKKMQKIQNQYNALDCENQLKNKKKYMIKYGKQKEHMLKPEEISNQCRSKSSKYQLYP